MYTDCNVYVFLQLRMFCSRYSVLFCFYVYCLCKCALYYCHRVSTQLPFTNISYQTALCFNLSFPQAQLYFNTPTYIYIYIYIYIYQIFLFKIYHIFIFSLLLITHHIKTTFALCKNRYPSLYIGRKGAVINKFYKHQPRLGVHEKKTRTLCLKIYTTN